jgi:hypothetical protein
MHTIKYNAKTNHIAGIEVRSESTGDANGGVVANYAQSTCGPLTRARLATGASFESLSDALKAARTAGGRKLCKTCEKAAEAALSAQESAPVLPAGWQEVPHARTGEVVGWLRPGEFRPVEKGMPTE